jgi:hypothetical protein
MVAEKIINETARESKRNARVAKKYKIYKKYLKTGARRNYNKLCKK